MLVGLALAAAISAFRFLQGALGPGVGRGRSLGRGQAGMTGKRCQGGRQERGSNKAFHADSGDKAAAAGAWLHEARSAHAGAWVNWSLKPCKLDAGFPLPGIEIWQLTIAFL